MAIPPLVLRIYADSTGVTAGLAKTQQQMTGFRGAMQRNSGLIKTALIGGVVVGVQKSIKAASDLNEQMNRSREVFEGSSASIIKFSQNTASGMGIAQAETLKAASNFGAMFDSAKIAEDQSAVMSTVLVKLASDMASFNDQDPSEMLDRLQGGLAGMARPLRNFGVFISAARVEEEALRLGLERGTNGFTDAQKVLARYNIILQDTKKQQGDFQRTLGESLPNQIRVLKAEFTNLAAALGKELLPVAVTVVQKVREFMPVIRFLARHLPEIAIALATWWTLGKIGKIAGTLRGIGAAAHLSGIQMAAFAVAAAAVVIAIKDIAEFQRMDEEQGKKWARGLEDGTLSVRKMRAELRILEGDQFDPFGTSKKSAEALRHALDGFNGTFNGTVRNILDGTAAGDRYNETLRTMEGVTVDQKAKLATLLGVQQNYGIVLSDSAQFTLDAYLATGNYRSALALLRGSLNGVLGPLRNVQTYAEKSGEAMGDAAQKTSRYAFWLRSLGDIHVPPPPPGFGGSTNPQQRAAGEAVSSWQPYIVGEAGPELFIPNTSGQIVPNSQMSGSGVTVNIMGDVTDPDRFARKVEAAVNRAAARH